MMNNNDDIFLAMVEEEFHQFNQFMMYKHKQMLKKREYKKLAEYSLRQVRIISFVSLVLIFCFSFISIYHFIDYGNHGNWVRLILGIVYWGFVILSAIYYSREILVKKRSLQRILKLLEARKQYLNPSKQPK